ncbi:hypothetical protein ACF0H5_002597 [Mactra antiquata]
MLQGRRVYQIFYLLLVVLAATTLADDSFLGGSITYTWIERNGKTFAQIDLTTGWLYGHGRCGATCDETKLNTNFTNRATLFADFTKAIGHDTTPLNSLITQNAVEQIIGLNKANNWEQNRMLFELEVGNEKDFKIQIDGSMWRWMKDIRGGPENWRLLANIPNRIRSDTNQRNRCPSFHVKPVYRVKLDVVSKIKLTVTDEDGDIIKCQKTSGREAEGASNRAGHDITVDTETCVVTVNANSSNGLKDQDMIPVTLKVLDYNRVNMKLGTEGWTSNNYALGTAAVQVNNRYCYSHAFLYFRDESEESRCFRIKVKENPFTDDKPEDNTKPSFVHFPASEQLVDCSIGTSCLLPIFIQSSSNVTKVSCTKSFVDEASISLDSRTVQSMTNTYVATLSFLHPTYGKNKICVDAKDITGKISDEACLNTFIEPPDACLSGPCKNAGQCVSNRIEGTFVCHCLGSYSGTLCEDKKNSCSANPCVHAKNCRDTTTEFHCYCIAGYTGDRCEINIDDCKPESCTRNGICKDGVDSFDCDCYERYEGINCSKDTCPEASKDLLTCPAEGCFDDPCHGNGLCTTGGVCWCLKGYDTDYNCSQRKGVPTVSLGKTTEQMKSTRVVNPPKRSNHFEGIDNIYSVEIEMPTNVADKEQNYVCLMASISTFQTTVCYELKFVSDDSQNTASNNTHFVPPTPVEGSSLKCIENERCSILLHTSSNNQTCEDVRSSTYGVRVIQTKFMDTSCLTEAMFEYSTAGYPCQNGGECFLDIDTGGKYHCICPKSYIGTYCEKGPCHQNTCQNNAYCQILNETDSCICQAGFQGQYCESSINQPDKQMQFIDLALPSALTCVVYKTCYFQLKSTSSLISPGYVSFVLQVKYIHVTKFDDKGNFMVSVQLMSKKEGTFDLCLQTIDTEGVNQDELCIKVTGVSDVSSLYGHKNLPHFIEPSLPTNAEVECVERGSCHVLYYITRGDISVNDEISLVPTKDDGFDIYYIYSNCQGVLKNIDNCTVDISIINMAKDVNTTKRFCGVISYGNGNNGEERCFDLSVVEGPKAKPKGCQSLHCHNGGFCDGHYPFKPVCYCRRGFAGDDCKTVVSPQAVFGGQVQAPFYVGQLGLPAEIQCLVRQTCVIPYQFVAKPGRTEAPDIFLGYVNPDIIVENPSMYADSKSNGVFFGSTTSIPLTAGVFKVCLQSLSDSKTVIEQCLDIRSVDSVEEAVDMTKPHFVQPTVPTETLLLCEVSKQCHIDIHYTNGEEFGFPGECPAFTSPEFLEGLHIFKSEYSTSGCTSDVTYIPSSVNVTHTFCIQLSFPGKKGENRCFQIQAVSDLSQNVTHPCTGMTCENEGKCIADFITTPATANCVCRYGYDGSKCEKDLIDDGHIVGTEVYEAMLDAGQIFDGNSAVPNNTLCYKPEACCLTVAYYGVSKHPPILESNDLFMKETSTYTPDKTLPTRHLAEICVEGDIGIHTLCLKTTSDGTKGGVITDELCLEIEIVSGGEHPIQALPHFRNSVSNGSRLSCHADSNCHFSMFTAKTTDESCEQVRECETRIGGTYVFPTQDANDLCVTDIAVKTGELHHVDEICVTAGVDGEKRFLSLESTCPLELGNCDHSHCLNIASCFPSDLEEAICVCDKQATGTSCDQVEVVKAAITDEGFEGARNNTLSGDRQCNCIVKEKEKTSVNTKAVVKSAGMGAGGMASAMGIAGAIFGIIKKFKNNKKHTVSPSLEEKTAVKPHKA